MLQQLVKAQREDVKAIIEEEGRQIDHLKSTLDAEVKNSNTPLPRGVKNNNTPYPTNPTPNPYPSPQTPPPEPNPYASQCQVKKNDAIEVQCLEMEDKVKLVLANHKMLPLPLTPNPYP